MSLDLTDEDIAILAMACRSAAHTANGRRVELRQLGKRATLAVTPEQFVALAERLERTRAQNLSQGMPNTSVAEWQAEHSRK